MNNTALISVKNKKNLILLCKIFKKFGIDIISTGETFNKIHDLGFVSKKIKDVTNFDEILEGRVKTLHPKIYGGILFNRKNLEHKNIIDQNNIPYINFVIVNLYPFQNTVKKNKPYEECINNIDIGGHALIRSAAKNYKHVTVITDLNDYKKLCTELINYKGKTSLNFRKKLAIKAFELVLEYDLQISRWFNNQSFLINNLSKKNLRYGENPHQRGFMYINESIDYPNFTKIYGKEISYNNINDINCAISCLNDFKRPCSVIVKHANPCGVACNNDIHKAFAKSLECDPQSAFGGIVALNKTVNNKIANKIKNFFIELIIAPNFTKQALYILKKKKIIILKSKNINIEKPYKEIKSVPGGYLEQDYNNIIIKKEKLNCVTNIKASKKFLEDMIFAFTVCKHVKSNAIVLAKNQQVLGIGAGQMSRVDSINLAINKMKKNFNITSSYIFSSDGFLPFTDNLNALKNSNCKGIIQPGGSKNDKILINKANSMNIPMYFTGIRHFKH